MSLYYVMKADGADRGEIIREGITSEQLQAADRLLRATKRLGLHSAATSNANSRDRAIRYGTATRHPYGSVRPVTTRKKLRANWKDEALVVALCLTVAAILVAWPR